MKCCGLSLALSGFSFLSSNVYFSSTVRPVLSTRFALSKSRHELLDLIAELIVHELVKKRLRDNLELVAVIAEAVVLADALGCRSALWFG